MLSEERGQSQITPPRTLWRKTGQAPPAEAAFHSPNLPHFSSGHTSSDKNGKPLHDPLLPRCQCGEISLRWSSMPPSLWAIPYQVPLQRRKTTYGSGGPTPRRQRPLNLLSLPCPNYGTTRKVVHPPPPHASVQALLTFTWTEEYATLMMEGIPPLEPALAVYLVLGYSA